MGAGQVAAKARQHHLGFGIAQADVVLQHLRASVGQHQAAEINQPTVTGLGGGPASQNSVVAGGREIREGHRLIDASDGNVTWRAYEFARRMDRKRWGAWRKVRCIKGATTAK